ncbi:MAG TPA: alpha/beta hydrolase [bacterium]|nr:alpha/beta hydrolase [bacterium]
MQIVFLHGFAAGGAIWDSYRPEFADALMPTLQFSDNGTPVLPELTGPAILVGWSMGGMIAIEMLRRQPQFVKGLLLVSSSPSYVASDIFPEGKALSAVRELRDAITSGDAKTLQSFQKQLFTAAEIRDGWLNRFRREIGPSLPTDPAILRSQLSFLETYRAPAELPVTPATILHGTGDAIVAPSAATAWRRLLPHATTIVTDAGHAIPFVHRPLIISTLTALRGTHGA